MLFRSVPLVTVSRMPASWREASSALTWDVSVGILSLTRDLVGIGLGPRYSLAGSVLRGPEREGRRPSPAWLGVSGATLSDGFIRQHGFFPAR